MYSSSAARVYRGKSAARSSAPPESEVPGGETPREADGTEFSVSEAQVHALVSEKGGVGKTTIAVNLAAVVYDALVSPEPIFNEVAQRSGDPDSPVLVASADRQASAALYKRRADRQGGLPFDFIQIKDPAELRDLRHGDRRHIFVDTAGSLEDEKTLKVLLEECDDALIPILPEPLSYDPTRRTIEQLLVPRGIPYRVVVNAWDPRDGDVDLKQTANYIVRMGWPMCKTVVRRYKIHTRASAEGMVVTQYPKNRVSMEARSDFTRLALELGYGGTVPQRQPHTTSVAARGI